MTSPTSALRATARSHSCFIRNAADARCLSASVDMARMQASSTSTAEESAWNKIFEVLRPPSRDRIQFLRAGHQIQAGDFAWASPWCPKDKEGMVHLTGYDERMLNI